MRVERLNDRSVVRLSTLDYGQCFSNDANGVIYMVTDEQRPSQVFDGTASVMVVDVEIGTTDWFNEDTLVRPLYAKVVVEW